MRHNQFQNVPRSMSICLRNNTVALISVHLILSPREIEVVALKDLSSLGWTRDTIVCLGTRSYLGTGRQRYDDG